MLRFYQELSSSKYLSDGCNLASPGDSAQHWSSLTTGLLLQVAAYSLRVTVEVRADLQERQESHLSHNIELSKN